MGSARAVPLTGANIPNITSSLEFLISDLKETREHAIVHKWYKEEMKWKQEKVNPIPSFRILAILWYTFECKGNGFSILNSITDYSLQQKKFPFILQRIIFVICLLFASHTPFHFNIIFSLFLHITQRLSLSFFLLLRNIRPGMFTLAHLFHVPRGHEEKELNW